MADQNLDRQIDRRSPRVQPLLYPQARRARPAAYEEPVLAERGAGALRARASRRTGGEGNRHRAWPRSRLPQPDRPEIRRRRADQPKAAGHRPAAVSPRADRQGTPDLCQARAQHRRTMSAPCSTALTRAAATGWSRPWPPSNSCSARLTRRRPPSCATTAPATWAGWCRATARSMPANMASTPRSRRWSPRSRQNSSTSFDASRERCWIAELDGDPRRLGVPGQAQRRCRKTSAAAGRAGRARTGPRPSTGRRVRRLRARPAATARSRCGPRASWSRRGGIYQNAGFQLVGERAASQFWAEPDRRDLGARAVKPQRRDQPRRLTPELLAFYKQRAKQLRDQAYIDAMHALWTLLKKLVGRR